MEEPSWCFPPPTDVRTCRFEVIKDGEIVDVLRVASRSFASFGRNSDVCHFPLQHESISRVHATCGFTRSGQFVIVDAGSAHGTTVNGSKLEKGVQQPLREGDVVKFGASTREYRVRGSSRSVAPAARPSVPGFAQAPPASSLPAAFGGVKKGPGATLAVRRAEAERGAAEGARAGPAALSGFARSRAGAPAKDAADDGVGADGGGGGGGSGEESGGTGAGAGAGAAGGSGARAEIAAIAERMGAESAAEAAARAVKRARAADAAGGGADAEAGPGGDEEGAAARAAEAEAAAAAAEAEALAHDLRLPVSHEAFLKGHRKTVAAVDVDAAGNRVATGSHDYAVRLWDFGGMNQAHRSFHDFNPLDGSPVVQVSWAPTGALLLSTTLGSKLTVSDRDGKPQRQTVRGDPYLVDVNKTRGHQSAVSDGHFHPTQRETFISSGQDSTVRIWNLNGRTLFEELINTSIIRARSANNTRLPVTCCQYSLGGETVAAGGQDGSLQLWRVRANFSRPDTVVRAAHPGGAVTRLLFARDGHTLVSRGTDHAVRVWDVRRLGKPVRALTGVRTTVGSANVALSPDGALLLAGTCVRRKAAARSELLVWRLADAGAAPALRLPLQAGVSAACVRWHPRINQIFLGMGDGSTRVLYSPALSSKGALMSCARPARRESALEASTAAVGEVHLPNAIFPDAHAPRKRRRKKSDPQEALRRNQPAKAPEGPTAYTGNISFVKHIMSTMEPKVNLLEQDPREEILRFAGKTDGVMVGNAYARTAPKAIFAEQTLEEEMEDPAAAGAGAGAGAGK